MNAKATKDAPAATAVLCQDCRHFGVMHQMIVSGGSLPVGNCLHPGQPKGLVMGGYTCGEAEQKPDDPAIQKGE